MFRRFGCGSSWFSALWVVVCWLWVLCLLLWVTVNSVDMNFV